MRWNLMVYIGVVGESFDMGWITVYIKGKVGFKDKVIERLSSAWLTGSYDMEKNLLMFWLRDPSEFRAFKKTIGSKLIFKYRLQFFTDLNDHLKSQRDRRQSGLSLNEEAMVIEMTTREKLHVEG
ncbi:MAG TPA: hypothetical protein VFW11_23175 [Cyclobacteriaceae bacterium]|nr:hypothetical protein [Cyclobacteriaceae bacterium]